MSEGKRRRGDRKNPRAKKEVAPADEEEYSSGGEGEWKPCKSWELHKTCRFGKYCIYRHGEEDEREEPEERPEGWRPPKIEVVKSIPKDLVSIYDKLKDEKIAERAAEEKRRAAEKEENDEDEDEDKKVRVDDSIEGALRWQRCEVVRKGDEIHLYGRKIRNLEMAWANLRNVLLRRMDETIADSANKQIFAISSRSGPFVFVSSRTKKNTRSGPTGRLFKFRSRGGRVDESTQLSEGQIAFTASPDVTLEEALASNFKAQKNGQVYLRSGIVNVTLEHESMEEVPPKEDSEDQESEEETEKKPIKPKMRKKEFSSEQVGSWKHGKDYNFVFDGFWQSPNATRFVSLLNAREFNESEKASYLETKCLEGGKWVFNYFKWVPEKSEEKVEAEDDEEAEVDTEPKIAGKWIAADRLYDTPNGFQSASGLELYSFHAAGKRFDKDILVQVVSPDKASNNKLSNDILAVLNSDVQVYNPQLINNKLVEAVPFLIAEFSVLRRTTLKSPNGSYSAQIQNVVYGNGRQMRPQGATVSFVWNVPSGQVDAQEVSITAQRLRDWLEILKEGERSRTNQNNSSNNNKRPAANSASNADLSDEALKALPAHKLKTLYMAHKRQTDKIHKFWVASLENKEEGAAKTGGRRRNNRRRKK